MASPGKGTHVADRSCDADGCHTSDGLVGRWCRLHYNRVYRTGSPDLQPKRSRPLRHCSVDGCGRTSESDRIKAGLCNKHYQRVRTTGSTELAVREWVMCDGPECSRRAQSVGYCPSHYQQYRLGKTLTPLLVATKDLGRPAHCQFPGCERPHKARGWCKAHRDQIAKGRRPVAVKVYGDQGQCLRPSCDQDAVARNLCRRHIQEQYDAVRKYGLSLDEYDVLVKRHGGRCAICGGINRNGHRLFIDHDHGCCPTTPACGKCVRGLLCSHCNYALGHMKDDVERLRSAIDYLQRNRQE